MEGGLKEFWVRRNHADGGRGVVRNPTQPKLDKNGLASEFRSSKARVRDKVIAFSIFVLMVGSAWFFIKPASPQTPVVWSEPFAWPHDCPRNSYNEGASIPRACASDAVIIKNPKKFGFEALNGNKGKRWYRIGNDALVIYCPMWARANYCTVYSRYPGEYRKN